MWAMWANIFKNFVHGPSASVALRRRPYPGASAKKQNPTRSYAYNPYSVVLWWGAMWALLTLPTW